MTNENWESTEADIPDGALKGVFSVSADKQVYFSQGNLYAKKDGSGTWKWGFYDKQYKYNSIATSLGSRTADGTDTEIDLFTWGYDNISTNTSYSLNPVNAAGISGHTTDGDKQLYPSEDWGSQIGDGSTWRTLSTAEWQYLFNTRSVNSGKKEGYSYQCATINSDATGGGVYGMILYPDGYTSQTSAKIYTSKEWASLEANGCVFLPVAGIRNGSDVYDVGVRGHYWSSTATVSSGAYRVSFSSDNVAPDGRGNRREGCSVRLVTDVSAAPAPTEPDYVMMKMGTGVDAYTLKWATKNLGAEKVATDYRCYGDYYQWGSVEKLYTSITWTDNTTGSLVELKTDGFAESNLTYEADANLSDAANDVVMKTYPDTGWRMPTSQEFQDLYDACGGTYDKEKYASNVCGESTEFTQGVYWCGNYDGVVGCLFVDEDGHKLFFPAAGDVDGTDLLNAGSYGRYWSSSLYPDHADAYYLRFSSANVLPQNSNSRYGGFSVRPVCPISN